MSKGKGIIQIRKDGLPSKRGGVKTHGLHLTKLYKVMSGMKQRCFNKNHTHYDKYGGRGIKVCQEWLDDFKAFYDWAINNGWQSGLQIDRIDNDGDYEPSNCRFVTHMVNCRNRGNNILITVSNITKTLAEWSSETGLSYSLLHKRYQNGWPPDRMLIPKTTRWPDSNHNEATIYQTVTPKQYKYYVSLKTDLDFFPGTDKELAWLNEMGSHGWNLVTIFRKEPHERHYYFSKQI